MLIKHIKAPAIVKVQLTGREGGREGFKQMLWQGDNIHTYNIPALRLYDWPSPEAESVKHYKKQWVDVRKLEGSFIAQCRVSLETRWPRFAAKTERNKIVSVLCITPNCTTHYFTRVSCTSLHCPALYSTSLHCPALQSISNQYFTTMTYTALSFNRLSWMSELSIEAHPNIWLPKTLISHQL